MNNETRKAAMLFLDQADMQVLTGYKQYARQIAFLKARRVPFTINAAGRPVVARAAIEGGSQSKPKTSWEPSWVAR